MAGVIIFDPEPMDDIPVAEPVDSHDEVAAGLLDRAVQSGFRDPNAAYLLALAYKRQGKSAEARAALRSIAPPDADVFLQMGLLSLQDNLLEQAEQELSRAWELLSPSAVNPYAIGYNLLLTRLCLGKFEDCLAILPTVLSHTQAFPQQRLFGHLQELLRHCTDVESQKGEGWRGGLDSPFEDMDAAEEKGLLQLIRGLGEVDPVYTLLNALAQIRPHSAAIQEAHLEGTMLRARSLMKRCSWTELMWLLKPWMRQKNLPRDYQGVLQNLLGCCTFLTYDFDKAIDYFSAALKLLPGDPRIFQNLALALESNGDVVQAETQWNRFLEALDEVSVPVPPDFPFYVQKLQFEVLSRLANQFAERERWTSAVSYLQRAHRLRPQEDGVLERLFYVYNVLKQPNNARKVIDKLRVLRPNDPQLDLYELDLVEPRDLNDIDSLLTQIDRIMRQHPEDARVGERAVNMVANVIPLMSRLSDQLTEQLNRVNRQVRDLSRHQIDWSALGEIVHDMIREFQKLRRITAKCLPLVSNPEHVRIVHDMADHLDEKIEACRRITQRG